jgi:hypothetical protein|tara:strand:- start:233 stop:499 length:267 start_codon:yes stop_codon:yes gene_type:complete
MAYTTYATDQIGAFTEVDAGNTFEYSLNDEPQFGDFPHKVWVASGKIGNDSGWRYARVLKTRLYIAVDEDENGPVVEKWHIKNHRNYQ